MLGAATLAELGGAQRIVEEHLEHALAGMDDEERDLVARLFNHLVTPSGTKIAYAVDDLSRYTGVEPQRLEPVLGTLEKARILRRVPGRSGGPPRYEIFHDVLAPAVLAWRDAARVRARAGGRAGAARRRHRRLAIVVILALSRWQPPPRSRCGRLSQRAEEAGAGRAGERGRRAPRSRCFPSTRNGPFGLLCRRRRWNLRRAPRVC